MTRILEVAHHRNGVSGQSFHAVRFTTPDAPGAFLATVFPRKKHIAVINTDLLVTCGVRFAENSWRGDEFESDLRTAITAWERGRRAS